MPAISLLCTNIFLTHTITNTLSNCLRTPLMPQIKSQLVGVWQSLNRVLMANYGDALLTHLLWLLMQLFLLFLVLFLLLLLFLFLCWH